MGEPNDPRRVLIAGAGNSLFAAAAVASLSGIGASVVPLGREYSFTDRVNDMAFLDLMEPRERPRRRNPVMQAGPAHHVIPPKPLSKRQARRARGKAKEPRA